jgi:hypothetical protein
VAQAAVAEMLIAAVGTDRGRQTVDRCLGALALHAVPWQEHHGGFETLVAASAPVFWGFFFLTGISLFVLRVRDKHRERPFTMPGYPLPPLVFCLTSMYMLYASLVYAKGLFLLAAAVVALGVPLYLIGRKSTTASPVPGEGPRSDAFPDVAANDGDWQQPLLKVRDVYPADGLWRTESAAALTDDWLAAAIADAEQQ